MTVVENKGILRQCAGRVSRSQKFRERSPTQTTRGCLSDTEKLFNEKYKNFFSPAGKINQQPLKVRDQFRCWMGRDGHSVKQVIYVIRGFGHRLVGKPATR